MSDFADYVLDLLKPLGPVTARRMFGGRGLYLEGAMFAMILRDTLYLCADDEMRAAFTEQGTGPFRYSAKGREIAVNRFYEAPAALLDDEDELRRWARHAVRAAAIPAKGARKTKPARKKPIQKKAGQKKPDY